MKLKTDGERETLRIVSFFTEKVEGSDVKQSVSAVSFLVLLPDLDPVDGQSEVAAGGLRRGGRRKIMRSFTLD